jgi:hypothetical protein
VTVCTPASSTFMIAAGSSQGTRTTGAQGVD